MRHDIAKFHTRTTNPIIQAIAARTQSTRNKRPQRLLNMSPSRRGVIELHRRDAFRNWRESELNTHYCPGIGRRFCYLAAPKQLNKSVNQGLVAYGRVLDG